MEINQLPQLRALASLVATRAKHSMTNLFALEEKLDASIM